VNSNGDCYEGKLEKQDPEKNVFLKISSEPTTPTPTLNLSDCCDNKDVHVSISENWTNTPITKNYLEIYKSNISGILCWNALSETPGDKKEYKVYLNWNNNAQGFMIRTSVDLSNVEFSFSQTALEKSQYGDCYSGKLGSKNRIILHKYVKAPVSSKLTESASTGDTILKIPDTDQSNFKIGDTIIIGGGTPNEEENEIIGFGSLLLKYELKFNHSEDTIINTIQNTPTPDASNTPSVKIRKLSTPPRDFVLNTINDDNNKSGLFRKNGNPEYIVARINLESEQYLILGTGKEQNSGTIDIDKNNSNSVTNINCLVLNWKKFEVDFQLTDTFYEKIIRIYENKEKYLVTDITVKPGFPFYRCTFDADVYRFNLQPFSINNLYEETTITSGVVAGDMSLQIPTNKQANFKIGVSIVIDEGTDIEEHNKVISHGSLILETPLLFDHGANANVRTTSNLSIDNVIYSETKKNYLISEDNDLINYM